jgi:hypothetical protein
MMMRLFLTAIVIATVSSSSNAILADDADDVASLKERIELLESQLKAVTHERDALKKELKQLKEPEGREDKTKDATPLGSVWKGKCMTRHLNNKTSVLNVECSVIARENKNVTFMSSVEDGAVYEIDCQYTTRHRFKIVSVRQTHGRVGFPDDHNPARAGGITGAGIADEKKLNLQWTWQRADDPLSGKYELTRAK